MHNGHTLVWHYAATFWVTAKIALSPPASRWERKKPKNRICLLVWVKTRDGNAYMRAYLCKKTIFGTKSILIEKTNLHIWGVLANFVAIWWNCAIFKNIIFCQIYNAWAKVCTHTVGCYHCMRRKELFAVVLSALEQKFERAGSHL